jgi:hypothetical protein
MEEDRQRVKVVVILGKMKDYSIVKFRRTWLPLASGGLPTRR